jgi:hypothetical protein
MEWFVVGLSISFPLPFPGSLAGRFGLLFWHRSIQPFDWIALLRCDVGFRRPYPITRFEPPQDGHTQCVSTKRASPFESLVAAPYQLAFEKCSTS